jgi:streptogramin lyase
VVPVGRGPVGFAVVGRGLWVANQFDRSVTLIDTATARPVRTVTVARLGVGFPVGGAGSVWLPDLTGSSGAVWRLDPDTGAVLARIPVGSLPSEAVFAFGSMWVTTGQDLVRVDPATGRLLARVGGLGANLDGIAVTPGAVWVGSIRDGTVSRIDPVRNRAVAAMAACPGVRHLAAVGADLWVACPGGGALLRLRPDSI